jgi:putative GTP pyrophosphokinase
LEGSEKKRPEEWGEAYASKRRTYLGYTDVLEALFRQLLDREGIPYVQIEGRTKEIPNFVSKLRRKNYEQPLAEVTDFSGIRLVLYYLDDVERVGQLIAEQFTVDDENSVDKGALMDPDRFGYLSVHYVVQPAAARKTLPEWSEFSDLWAEIQVRTVLQHAWGAISRKLTYASVREAPRDLQRSLNRLSALLELADEQFLDIREARGEIEQQYDREVERGNLDLAVDESSLESYLRESGIDERISILARAAGSPSHRRSDNVEFEEEARQEDLRMVLGVLRNLEIERISELDQRLDDLWSDIPGFMGTVNKKFRRSRDGLPISDSPLNWLVLILLWSFKVPAEQLTEVGYVSDLAAAVTSCYDGSSG